MITVIAWLFLLSAIVIAGYTYYNTRQHPESMNIMNIVWVLTALWASFGALVLYRRWSIKKPKMAVQTMEMNESAPMTGTMNMGATRYYTSSSTWRPVVLSTLHCGAGCVLADLVGEGMTYFFPIAIGGSLIAGSWVLDFILALCFGIFFQYMAMKQMQPSMSGKQLIGKAAKADILSLTAWQVGMYGWMAICYFVIFPHGGLPKDSATFWFMMQLAMLVGFCTALPMNYLLIKWGIKKAM